MSEPTTDQMRTGVDPSIPAVALRGLHKAYRTTKAVDGVDLVIAPGEVVALWDPTGPASRPRSTCCSGWAVPTPAR
jgi:ABC-type branched-subunit amino acid transport system ATPase component